MLRVFRLRRRFSCRRRGGRTGDGEQGRQAGPEPAHLGTLAPWHPGTISHLKMAFGIFTCTPIVPSTSWVIATSPAMLVSW